jgi:hypothetical protein
MTAARSILGAVTATLLDPEVLLRHIERLLPARAVLGLVCLALVGSAAAPLAPASAQTLDYDVGVDFPEFVVLYFWDQITVDISATELATYMFGGTQVNAGSASSFGTFTGGGIRTDAKIDDVVDDGLLVDPDDPVWLGVANAWALRSVSSSGQTQVSIKVKKKDGKQGRDKITAKTAHVSAASQVGKTIVVPSTGYSFIQWGNIYLELDLTKASTAGTYRGIEVEIKAENI